MTITFRLHYQTEWGQRMDVVGDAPGLGEGDPMNALRLEHQGDGYWGASVELEKWPRRLTYRYMLVEEATGNRTTEWGEDRLVSLDGKDRPDQLFLMDSWRPHGSPDHAFYTSAFQDVILRQPSFRAKPARNPEKHPTVRFQLDAPQVPPGFRLAICGSIDELGNWNLEKPLLLGNRAHPQWSGKLVLRSGLSIEYKYGLADANTGQVVELEAGPNRLLTTDWLGRAGKTQVVVSDTFYRHPEGNWRGTGVAMPVFSLRTEQSLGVGEFADLKRLVDWAGKTGMNMVQILPVNDTSATGTWTDSYPYAAISVFALHPLYLRLEGLSEKLPKKWQAALKKKRAELNALPEVDYEAVMAFKLEAARAVYHDRRKEFLAGPSFRKFLESSAHWLKPYAAFCYLRDTYGTVDFHAWGEYADYSEVILAELLDPKGEAYEEIGFYFFLQYHLDRQLGEAAAYARDQGIILKGDIPIGIYRNSVDAWVAPELYNMDGQSGAPPDPFSDTGQNWGFPTYNWGEMAKDGYTWWQQRLQQLSRYFDAFRIDHILGFFRIWEIPVTEVQGLMGHFNPAIPVRIQEFEERGIPFERDRFCRPFITDEVLRATFGEEAERVRNQFLRPTHPGRYELRAAFDTQRKIEVYFRSAEHADSLHLKQGLYDLVGEVLFFEGEGSGGEAFHPRILMQKTWSFRSLPADVRSRLEALYIDYFYRRQEAFWRQQAMTKLPAIKAATNMLICGEDLGMVPDCVPGVMDELGILSLEIQRMSKNPKTEFLAVEDIPYLSVCSPSTHDMAPLRAWWEELDAGARQRFFHQQLGLAGSPPPTCEPGLAERIILQHLHWPSMWAVFPIQDLLAMDGDLRRDDPHAERINVPANPKHYWRYRLHLTLEELLKADEFNQYVHQLVTTSGRGAPTSVNA